MDLLSFPWYTYVIAAVGGSLCVGGIVGMIAKALWLLRTEKTVGVIFDHKTYASQASTRLRYSAMLRYQIPAGETYTLTSRVSWGKPLYEIGAEMPVVYNPRDPKNAEIADFLNLWMLDAGLVFEGVLLLVMIGVYTLTF